jgi:diguanylate cyclase (GGDEF)-like protein/PAS domain S-box-containing protein
LRIAASVFINAQEGITITDAGGFIADINPAFTRITGYSRDDVLGRSPKMLSSGHQDSAFYARMWQSIENTGAWRGEIWNRNKNGEVYPELLSVAAVKDEAEQISHYIATFSDITHLKEREAQLDRLAHYDPLTRLPNRRLLTDRLRQAIANTKRSGKIMAVCLVDLDGFKPINDTYGHAVGDLALTEIARRLTISVREDDTVARLGGDEFVLLLQNLEWVEECDTVLTRILQALAAPLVLDALTVSVTASIGVTLFPQDHNADDVLLQNADHAMYLAKQAGRNCYQLFNPEHDRLVRDYRRLVEDLNDALLKDQFVLHYQPKVNMAAGLVVGVEALIRWRHPERGLLAPAEFLYAVTHAELETRLDHWVVDKALQQVAQWKAQDLHLPISINLSPRSLLDENFTPHLTSALSRYPDLTGSDLEIEIPETESLVSEDKATTTIQACQALGLRFALDDFGGGYSSLPYFRQLPVDVLKIDQNFVRDMCDDKADLAIVEGVIKIARGFNREVVAKAIENADQANLLLQLGCQLAQGYAIARPMPADSLQHWLANWSGYPEQNTAG